MDKGFYDSFQTDVLVVGGGYAGIKAAYECAKAGLNVTIIIKERLCSGSSFYPYMDMIGCLLSNDDREKDSLLSDINKNSMQMNDKRLCEIYVDEIGDRIRELNELGFEYDVSYGRNACFAEKPYRIVTWSNFDLIKKNVRNLFNRIPNLKVMEHFEVIHLLKKDSSVIGAIAADSQSQLFHINTRNIIMANGGYCGLYKHNLNTSDICGQGHILALDAGAKLINIEFIQFIPGMLVPHNKTLFSEQTLEYCMNVLDAQGNEVLERYLPEGVSTRECLDMRSQHGPFTCKDISKYFDIAIVEENKNTEKDNGCRLVFSERVYTEKNDFLNMYLSFLNRMSIDLVRDEIRVAPFAHAANGGVMFNGNCETGVDGLYVAGELSGGLHGADRLGGLASGSCFVFGKRAANSVISNNKHREDSFLSDDFAIKDYLKSIDNGMDNKLSGTEVMVEIGRTLTKYANVIRIQDELEKGLNILEGLYKSYNPVFQTGNRNAVKAKQSLKMAMALFLAMKERKESRGSHFRKDYPNMDNERFGQRLSVYSNEGKLFAENL